MYGDEDMEENPFLDDGLFDDDMLDDLDEEGRYILLTHYSIVYLKMFSQNYTDSWTNPVRSNVAC